MYYKQHLFPPRTEARSPIQLINMFLLNWFWCHDDKVYGDDDDWDHSAELDSFKSTRSENFDCMTFEVFILWTFLVTKMSEAVAWHCLPVHTIWSQFSKWSVWALVLLLSKVWSEFTHVRSQHLMSTTTKLCLTWIPPRNMHYKAEAFVQLQLSWLNFDHTFTLLSTDWFPCSHATDPFSLCMLSLFLVHKNPSYIGKFENEILSLSTQLFLGSQISASAKFSKLNPLQIIALKS